MPSKNRNKIYIKNGCYHVFNRGVDKRKIFMDKQDYAVFLHLIKHYLSPSQKDEKHPLSSTPSAVIRPRPITNLHKEVDLLAFCLMPNHFHLLIKQKTTKGMTKLVHKLLTIFSMYFNRRYKRIGHLFQGRYKAVLVDNDDQLLCLSRYIHSNPIKLTGSGLVSYPYSSFSHYLGKKTAKWVKPKKVLDVFDKSKTGSNYKAFIINNAEDTKEELES